VTDHEAVFGCLPDKGFISNPQYCHKHVVAMLFEGDISAAETAGSLFIAYESLEGEVSPEYKDIINKVSVSKYNVVRTYGMLMKRLFRIKELKDWIKELKS
jgi:hypothetical protein